MRLTFKLVCALVIIVVTILGVDAYLSVQRESVFLRTELQRKAYRIGNAMKELVAEVWRREGSENALALIEAANQRERLVLIRWVWLDETGGERFRPQAPADRINRATRGETVTLQYQSADGAAYLLTYVSVNVDRRPGALELSEPLNVADDFVRISIYRKIVLAGIVVASSIGVMLAMGIWLVGWPLKRLIDKARRVSGGDLTGPIAVRSRDELSELADTLNLMCDNLSESQNRLRTEAEARVATVEQLRHADRLRTVGQLASGVAHELGTPLNVVTGRASMITSGRLAPEAIIESATIIKSQAERMAGIIRQLLDFSRSSSSHRVQVDLRMIVRETVGILDPLSRKHGVELIVDSTDDPMSACVDPGQIRQVLTNLIVNAIQATQPGGRVAISVSRDHPLQTDRNDQRWKNGCFCLTVTDNGCGIPDDVRNRLFEPFVTTKEIGQGTGLGLSIAYGIVKEHGGEIDVQTEPGRGSQFRVFLPGGEQPCQGES